MNTVPIRKGAELAREFARETFTHEVREAAFIFAASLAALGALLLAIWELHLHFVSRWIMVVPLSLATSCILLQTFLGFVLVTVSACIKRREQIDVRRAAQRRPILRERLAAYSLGGGLDGEMAALHEHDRRDFEQCLVEFLQTTHGAARARLSSLAAALGMVERWKQKARSGNSSAMEWLGLLADSNMRSFIEELARHRDGLIRTAALRVMAREGGHAQRARVLTQVFASPLLVRVMLAGELRRYAEMAAPRGIPDLLSALAKGPPEVLLAALEMMESWRCGLPLPDLAALIQHNDFRIRAVALGLAAFDGSRAGANDAWARASLPASYGIRQHLNQNSLVPAVVRAIDDSHPKVRAAALNAAARMDLRCALDSIARCAAHTGSDAMLSSLACRTLAKMGDAGRAVLEKFVMHGGGRVAAAAAESLASAKLSIGEPRTGTQ